MRRDRADKKHTHETRRSLYTYTCDMNFALMEVGLFAWWWPF